MGIRKIIKKILKLEIKEPFLYLQQSVIELNNYQELKKIFGWEKEPILDRRDINDFESIEDVNERRIKDAECLAIVMRNLNPKNALEIGTSDGLGTLLMSVNSPSSTIYTVNILPEEIHSGEGGIYTTIAHEKEKIGIAFKERGIKNIHQIFANTVSWQPDFDSIEVAFIDGCHDTEFVINDTKKIINYMKPGSIIMWHDFNLDLVKKYPWINTVCLGVEKLFEEGIIKGRIFHVKDSWIGIYQI